MSKELLLYRLVLAAGIAVSRYGTRSPSAQSLPTARRSLELPKETSGAAAVSRKLIEKTFKIGAAESSR
jgi:hypothetical protein